MILTFYGLSAAQCHCLIRTFIPSPVRLVSSHWLVSYPASLVANQRGDFKL